MRVRAWGPSNLPRPCVPEYVDAFEGSFSRTGEYLNDMFTVACPQMEIPDGWWLGVHHDGTVESFKLADEQAWRARAAMAAVDAASKNKDRPEDAVDALRAAADVVGFDLAGMLEELEAARSDPKEDLVEVFKRVRKKP